MTTLIEGGRIVNDGQVFEGSVMIKDDVFASISEGKDVPCGSYDKRIDATGCFILPGIIDTHVHFREPGLTEKADMESESRAAAWGGVTSFFDMPNTVPQTTTLEALEEKFAIASRHSHVNYSFFYGATNDNAADFLALDVHRIPGIKLFMGSSTGNMLVDKYASLLSVFKTAAQAGLHVMAHCEDTDVINRNMTEMKKVYGDDPDVLMHPLIRSAEACYESSALAVQLARTFGTKLHVAHLSTAKELSLPFTGLTDSGQPSITAEAVVAHLFFTSEDYITKRALIKCNPAIKTAEDRQALREALVDGRIVTVATDHAPHLLAQKQGGCARAMSGMPMIQFSLPTMLELVDEGVLPIERMVELMCHHPARLFEVRDRGYIREGAKADLVIVRPQTSWTVTKDVIQSKCKWSPMEGHTYHWQVEKTFCNGHLIYNKGEFDNSSRGEEISFR